jgi:hypothetical protein
MYLNEYVIKNEVLLFWNRDLAIQRMITLPLLNCFVLQLEDNSVI